MTSKCKLIDLGVNLRPVDGTLSVILRVAGVSFHYYVNYVLSDKIVEDTADYFEVFKYSV